MLAASEIHCEDSRVQGLFGSRCSPEPQLGKQEPHTWLLFNTVAAPSKFQQSPEPLSHSRE